jgi:hypothetical protein
MRVVALRIIQIVIVITLVTTAAWPSNDAFVTVQSLTADLESRNIDRIDKSLNDIKTMSYKGQILPFVAELWEQRKDKHPSLPWDVIGSEIVRVELADILLQAVKNGRMKLDPKPMHRFVSSLINSNDLDVVRKSIGALSIVDDEGDVDGIHQVARRKDPATFRIAVLTLIRMCNPKAARAIVELETSITEASLKAYIADNKRKSEEFKKETMWCDPVRLGLESK